MRIITDTKRFYLYLLRLEKKFTNKHWSYKYDVFVRWISCSFFCSIRSINYRRRLFELTEQSDSRFTALLQVPSSTSCFATRFSVECEVRASHAQTTRSTEPGTQTQMFHVCVRSLRRLRVMLPETTCAKPIPGSQIVGETYEWRQV